MRLGRVRSGRVRSGKVRLGKVRSGMVRSVRQGEVKQGEVRQGEVRHGEVRWGECCTIKKKIHVSPPNTTLLYIRENKSRKEKQTPTYSSIEKKKRNRHASIQHIQFSELT